ncbi:transmembrane protein 94-like, partial [Clarias magur]
EYGEVVCCLGSRQNINNNAIFLQSDISIALEPLVPLSCLSSNDVRHRIQTRLSDVSPSQLSNAICGLACTVQLQRQDNNMVIKLIRQ